MVVENFVRLATFLKEILQTDAIIGGLESFVGNGEDMFRFSSDDSKLNGALNKSVQVANLMIRPYQEKLDEAKVLLSQSTSALLHASNKLEKSCRNKKNRLMRRMKEGRKTADKILEREIVPTM